MRLVHLSDIHLSKDRLKDFKQFYLKALLKDLNEINKIKKIDIIAITGDLVDKGGHSFQSNLAYSSFEKEFLGEIVSKINIGNDRIFFIPGNHDIDETLIDEFIELGIRTKLQSIENINSFIDKYHKGNHEALNRNNYFKKFEKKYFKKLKTSYITNFESGHIVNVDNNKKVGIGCLNSAWRCSSKLSKDDLLLGTRQILNLNDYFTKNQCDFVVGLIHHPIDYFANIEKTEISAFLQNLNFDALLMGHIHEGRTIYTIGNMGTLYTSVSRSSFNNPRERIDEYKSGYVIYDFDLDLLNVNAQFRKYYHKRIEFGIDTDYSDTGMHYTELIPRKDRAPFLKLLKLNNKSLEVYKNEINSSLLISGTNTIAPKNLNDIFVLPKLSENPVSYEYEHISKPKFLALQEILSFQEHILFLGSKEIGKTTLLNKIYLELSENFHIYQKIPIYFDFKELKNKRIKTLVSKFLNEPPKETEQLLTNGEITILLDNVDDSEKNKYAKTSLREFISEFPNVKIIATTNDKIEILLAKENSYLELLSFKTIFIGYVSTKEFKDLICKWFSRDNPDWIRDNLEKLLKVFELLRIPRTFFAISLFLWIVEKQENFKPVNKANLVDQFLLFILEGLRIENAEAGAYNYIKKIDLLKEIAIKMYEDGDEENEYALLEIDVLKAIEENFNLNQRSWTIPDKLSEFIEKGILKMDQGSNHIKFRYECFFEYFLSFNIDNDKDFKEKVFSDDEFLSFLEEIDYYTARNQSDLDTLKWIYSKLDEAFKVVDENISDDVDEYLPPESMILRELKTQDVIPEIRKNKLSDEQIEQMLDAKMEHLSVADSVTTKKQLEYKNNFPIVLELAGRVLKNSENVKKPDLINNYLDTLILKTAKYSIFFQSLISKNLHKKFESVEIDEKSKYSQFILMLPLMPIISQLLLLTWVGTEFISIPLIKKIEKLSKGGKGVLSEYELFFTLFLYTDLKLPNSIKKIDKAIGLITKESIAELFFFKVFLYYMFKSEKDPDLSSYENQMKNLIAKAKGISSKSAKQIIYERVRKIKEDFNSNGVIPDEV